MLLGHVHYPETKFKSPVISPAHHIRQSGMRVLLTYKLAPVLHMSMKTHRKLARMALNELVPNQ